MEKNNILYQYQNGNTNVTILNDGTKIREYDENIPLIIDFPESIDVKITNYCDMNCQYCHESSTTKGIHGDLDILYKQLIKLPNTKGIELALGGGNPLSHPDLVPFLVKLKEKDFITNITINQGHLLPYNDLIKYLINGKLVYGVGISIINNNFKYIDELMNYSNNIVFHCILGIVSIDTLKKISKYDNSKILLLGYKKHGFGIKYYNEKIEPNILKVKEYLPKLFQNAIISFDNLAIEQLNLKDILTIDAWETFYMGDDFTFTMYIDSVEQKFAPTSRSGENERLSFNFIDINDYFKIYRNKLI